MLSTTKEMREKHMDKLLNEYYDSMCMLLQLFDCDSKEIFSDEIFRQHFKQFGRIGVGLGIFAFPQYENYFFDSEDCERNQNMICNYKKRLNDVLDDTIKYCDY